MKKLFLLIALALMLCACAAAECSHEWGSFTEKSDSLHSATCSLCGETRTQAHSLTLTERIPATCLTPAQLTYACQKCSYTVSYSDGGVSDEHSFGDYMTEKEPSCTAEGLQKRVCTVCGAEESLVLAKADHSFSGWQARDEYWHEKVCSVCGETESERHDQAISRTITLSQSARLGKKNLTCSVCSYSYKRYFNESGKLIATDSEDIFDTGTKYIPASTITLSAGDKKAFTLYPACEFTLTASSDCEMIIYANADTLEYRALAIEGGNAVIEMRTPQACIESLSVVPGATLTLTTPLDAAVLSISGAGKQISAYKCTSSRFFTVSDAVSGSMQLYSSDSMDMFSLSSGTPIGSVHWSFNPATRLVAADISDENGIVSVSSPTSTLLSGEGNSVQGILAPNDIADGWYVSCTFPSAGFACATPLIDENGKAMYSDISAPAAADTSVPGSAEPAPTPGIDEPQPAATPVPEVVDLLDGEVHTVNATPAITLQIADGKYKVTVTGIPSKWKLDKIVFVQSYARPGMRILSNVAAEVEFEIINEDSRLSATVYLVSNQGETAKFPCGNVDYRRQ